MTCKRPTCTRAAVHIGWCNHHIWTDGPWRHQIDATPTRTHLRALHNAGMGSTNIARASGIHDHPIREIMNGNTSRIRQSTARKLLAVTLRDAEYQPAWRAARRLKALRANGWTSANIADTLGMSKQRISTITHGHTSRITTPNFSRIDALYQDKPHRIAAPGREAALWAPTCMWDNIDNPDENAEHQVIAEHQDPRVILNALIDHYGTAAETARALGMTHRAISGIKTRRDTTGPTVARRIRQHWCDLHNLTLPDIDPIHIPEHVRRAVDTYATDVGMRWLSLTDNTNRRSGLPRVRAAAETLNVPESVIEKCLDPRGRGWITPQELDQLCTALGIEYAA